MSTSSHAQHKVTSIDKFFNVMAIETLALFEDLEFAFLYEFVVFTPAST